MFLGLATAKKVELLVRKMQVRFQLRISFQAILEAKVLLINKAEQLTQTSCSGKWTN